MSTKLALHLSGRRFDIDVDEDFAAFLQEQMNIDFNVDGNNDVKAILQAYVRANHERFLSEQKVEEILQKLEKE